LIVFTVAQTLRVSMSHLEERTMQQFVFERFDRKGLFSRLPPAACGIWRLESKFMLVMIIACVQWTGTAASVEIRRSRVSDSRVAAPGLWAHAHTLPE
jgi:hypothetical protein